MINTVYELITDVMAKQYPDRVAFRYVAADGKTVVEKTYAQYVQDIRRAVTYFKENIPDIKGKRVGIMSRNCYEYGVNSFGAILAGAVVVTINQKKTWPELEYELGLVEPSLIVNDGIDYGCRPGIEAAYGDKLRPMDAFKDSAPAELVDCVGHDDLMVLMFTSGTTGRSKAVMLSERNFFTTVECQVKFGDAMLDYKHEHMPEDKNDVLSNFAILPLFHLGTFICLFVWACKGWALNLSADIRDFYRDLGLMHSDAIAVAPMLMEAIYKDVKRGRRARLNGIWNPCGSSAMFDGAMLAELAQQGMMITQVYGMTETCGDVGFGKTEVAIRAAFKAAVDGKQVAVLVPTTILALQHYRSFSERLRDFPVRVEYLNRTKTAKEAGQIRADLESGRIDILIGTHKILGKQIKFRDLGLLIIDEEQKFGVAAKEKLTQMAVNVDTLTLTATPIPRTLQFSLMGSRDLSVISTPPPNRQPIVTESHVFSEEIIRDAVEAELARGGQVYFVHNRVEDLMSIQGLITRVCPKARVAVGHGKMPAEKLEKLIMDFIYGEFDVLVSTTIIENGIDIPNANTIIVDNAQNFGLSDLHQLRGRVGRSNQKAYCYLLSPPEEMLSSDARRRLRAIEEFSDLGSGFNIAMQDLDIRGAGNLLGAEQSGFIADIGFETYQKIMNEAIAELRAEGLQVAGLGAAEQDVVEQMHYVDDAHIEIEVEAGLPDAYVAQQAERLKLYRELDSTKDEAALQAFESRLADRFGPLPREAQELLNVVRLRWEAIRLGIERVKVKNGLMILHFVGEQNSPYYKSDTFMELLRKVTQNPARFVLKQHNNRLAMTVRNVKDIEDGYKTLQQL